MCLCGSAESVLRFKEKGKNGPFGGKCEADLLSRRKVNFRVIIATAGSFAHQTKIYRNEASELASWVGPDLSPKNANASPNQHVLISRTPPHFPAQTKSQPMFQSLITEQKKKPLLASTTV